MHGMRSPSDVPAATCSALRSVSSYSSAAARCSVLALAARGLDVMSCGAASAAASSLSAPQTSISAR